MPPCKPVTKHYSSSETIMSAAVNLFISQLHQRSSLWFSRLTSGPWAWESASSHRWCRSTCLGSPRWLSRWCCTRSTNNKGMFSQSRRILAVRLFQSKRKCRWVWFWKMNSCSVSKPGTWGGGIQRWSSSSGDQLLSSSAPQPQLFSLNRTIHTQLDKSLHEPCRRRMCCRTAPPSAWVSVRVQLCRCRRTRWWMRPRCGGALGARDLSRTAWRQRQAPCCCGRNTQRG